MEALSNEFPSYEPPYVTKKTDALLRVWGSAASFVFRGGAPRFGYPRLKAQRRDTETKNLPYLYN